MLNSKGAKVDAQKYTLKIYEREERGKKLAKNKGEIQKLTTIKQGFYT